MTSTNPSSTTPRSPIFGTATFSQSQSYTDSHSYTYSDDDSFDDTAEVEAALTNIENELTNAEDVLTEWSSDPSSYTTLSGTYSTTSTPQTAGTGPLSTVNNTDRDRRVLSTISEHTENILSSRPTSGVVGSRPITQHSSAPSDALRRSTHLSGGAVSPSPHARSSTEPGAIHTPGRTLPPPPVRRAGDLIAFFEDKTTTPEPAVGGHSRTASAPAGPRSPSPYFPSTTGYGYSSGTGFGYSTAGYTSRPSSPSKSRTGTTGTSPFTMSSFFSPPPRVSTSLSGDSRAPSSPMTRTETGTPIQTGTITNTYSTFTSTLTNTNTNTITGTPTASTLRRPQTSPRSPLTSVRNIVAAWKERTPLSGRSGRSPASSAGRTPSPARGEGLFSVKRRADRGQTRLRERALGMARRSDPPAYDTIKDEQVGGSGVTPRSTSGSLTGSALLPPPFDLAELGVYARGSQEPLRIGLLWYLNVHAPPPYRWQRCQALLYPHMLLLSWIAPGGGRGVVNLDLLNCTEVRSVPTPMHPSAQDDVGTIAARMQSQTSGAVESGSGEMGETGLMETLCPFQLLYSDGIERLGAESARERVRWVSAIWEVLDRSVTIPDRSVTRSPTGSIRTIESMTSTSSKSASGSASTVFVPPLDSIPDLSDLRSLSGSSSRTGLSRGPSFALSHRTRATDDGGVSGQGYLYPGDPRVIAPSRSSSIRRTSSLTDLDAEFASAVSRARASRPGLGFGLGLAGGVVLGEGSPVTISSGSRLGDEVWVTPPPSARSKSRSRGTASKTSSEIDDEAFFTAGSKSSGTESKTSSFYSSLSITEFTGDARTTTGTTTGLGVTSGSGTDIVTSSLSLRRTTSGSYLGDSSSGSTHSSSYTPTSPPRSGLSRTRGVRRRSGRQSSRTFSSSSQSRTDEGSDKENTESYTQSRSESDYDDSSRSRSDWLSNGACSCSSSGTCSTCLYSTSSVHCTEEASDSDASPPTIPSSNYSTAEVCSTEYSTAEVCSTEYSTAEVCSTEYSSAELCPTPSVTDYITADVCPSEPLSEYSTAEVCATEPSTDYDTAECRCIPSIDDEEAESIAPSAIPTIPSDVESEILPEDIPLPSSTYSLSWPPTEVSITEMSESRLLPTEDFTPSTVSSVSISGPSPIESSLPSSISSPTESSVTPTMTQPSLTIPSSLDFQPTPPSPSIRESMWATESDRSYESSVLQASPSVQSIAVPEGQDVSYDTSFLRPSGSIISSEELPRLSPIAEVASSITPSSPSSVTATPVSLSLPSDVISPSEVPTESSVSVTRTPSTISSASSISMRSSMVYPHSLFEIIVEPPTEPSLLSTHRSPPSPGPIIPGRPISPAFIPLPSSPAPQTPEASISVSITTPVADIPSIHSDLETAPSPRSEILTHDVNRLLQYLHELEQSRSEDNRELTENIRDIREELYDLSDFLHEKCPVDAPPPVPQKDESLRDSRSVTPVRSVPAGPRPPSRPVETHLIPIPLTPPPLRPVSPSSLTSSISFLSSPHSDDFSLMESETYPLQPDWPPEGSSSPPSSRRMSPSISSSSPSSGPYLSATSPSSPTFSQSSVVTVRPAPRPPSVTLADLLHHLEQLRQQTAALQDAQMSANQTMDELRHQGPVATGLTECCEKIQRIEDMLLRVLDQLSQRPIPTDVESVSETSADRARLQGILDDIGRRVERPFIHMPVPVRPGPSLDEQLADLLGPGPQLPPPTVQQPPPLIPFVYRPAPHRPRSVSPGLEAQLPPRPHTFPIPEPRALRRPYRPRPAPRPPRYAQDLRREEPPVIPESIYRPDEPDTRPSRPVESEYGPDFLRSLRELRSRRHPDTAPDGFFNAARPAESDFPADRPQRPTTAPAGVTSGPYVQPGQPSSAGPPPGSFVPQPPPGGLPPFMVMPPGSALPPELRAILEMLRENRVAQHASIEQQREIMRYLRGLNEWLGRDVHDRQAEIRGVSARVDRLREDLDQFGMRQQPEGVPVTFPQPYGPQPPPPIIFGPGGGPQPTGPPFPTQGYFQQPGMPQPPVIPNVVPGYAQGPTVTVIPPDRSPSRGSESPVIPPMYPQPPVSAPYGPSVSMPYGPQPPPGMMYRPERSESPDYIPPDQPQMPIPMVPPPQAPGPTYVIGPPPQAAPTTFHVPRSESGSQSGSQRSSPSRRLYLPPSEPQYEVEDQPTGPRAGSPRHPEVSQPMIVRQSPPPLVTAPQQPYIINPPQPAARTSPRPSPRSSPPLVIREDTRSPVYDDGGRGQTTIVMPGPSHPSQPPPFTVHPASQGRPRVSSYSPRSYRRPTIISRDTPSPPIDYDDGRRRSRSYSPIRTVVTERRPRGVRTVFVDPHGRPQSPRPSDHVVAVLPHDSYSRTRPRRGSRSLSPQEGEGVRDPYAPTTIVVPSPPPHDRREPSGEHDRGDGSPRRGSTRPRLPESDPRRAAPTIVRMHPSDRGDSPQGLQGRSLRGSPEDPGHDYRTVDEDEVPRVPTRTPSSRPGVVHVPSRRPTPVRRSPTSFVSEPTNMSPLEEERSYTGPLPTPSEYHPPPPSVYRPPTPRTELDRELRRRPSTEPVFPRLPTGDEPDTGIAPGRAPTLRRSPYAPSGITRAGSPTSAVPVPPRHVVSEHDDLMYADAERSRQERFDELQRQLEDAEDRREEEFQQREGERDERFGASEARRDEEASQRRDEIWQDLERRLAGELPPPRRLEPGVEPPEPGAEHLQQDTASVIDSMRAAATQHADEIREIVTRERENMIREREAAEAERERLREEAQADRMQLTEAHEARIRQLEEELMRTRAELENEKQQRMTEEAEARERAREEALERDEGVRNQLSDITNIVQEQRDCCTRKKEVMDERWAEKQTRRAEKDTKCQDLLDLVNKLIDDREVDRARAEDERIAAEGRPGIERVLEDLALQNQQQRDMLTAMAEGWRADSQRQHEETLNAVRATAQEQVPFNVQGYLDEFSKALASEVRMLLGEVGRLREERRALHFEIGYLLCTRSKYGPGGEFDPEWRPPNAPYLGAGPPPPEVPPEPPAPEEPMQARPAWRSVPQRGTRRTRRRETPAPATGPAGQPGQPPPVDRPNVSSWATWQPDPQYAPSPSSMVEQNLVVPAPSPPGLFGPRSPSGSIHR